MTAKIWKQPRCPWADLGNIYNNGREDRFADTNGLERLKEGFGLRNMDIHSKEGKVYGHRCWMVGRCERMQKFFTDSLNFLSGLRSKCMT